MAEGSQTRTADALLPLLLRQGKDNALILLDAQGIVVGWYPAAEWVFGYAAAEMLGQPLTRLFTPEDVRLGLADHELAVARRDGASEDDRWMVRKDGTRLWASGVLLALQDDAGHVVGFGKTLRDRTDVRARAEAVENRVAALLKADERKDVFLGTLAHELRNPLAPLANAVQLLRLTRPEDAGLALPVGIIERQVQSLRRLVDDLLDLTRIREGKVELKKEAVRLGEVLCRAVESCRPRAEGRRQHLELIVPAGAIWLQADPGRLHQVFTNLITNAVKYTPAAGHIWVKATVEGKEAVVAVEDTGVGIAPEVLPRIFDLFTQEESSRPLSGGGLGIGLSLVKNLTALHGGTVQVRSDGKGKGSEFTVRLPVGPASGPAAGGG
jgi:two-component system CheB/CheR fusion protein